MLNYSRITSVQFTRLQFVFLSSLLNDRIGFDDIHNSSTAENVFLLPPTKILNLSNQAIKEKCFFREYRALLDTSNSLYANIYDSFTEDLLLLLSPKKSHMNNQVV